MKRIFLISCSLIFLFLSCTQKKLIEVKIKVYSENLAPSTQIYIAGNNTEFGNWQPNVVKLERKNNHWEKTFQFNFNTVIEFKFTKGSWDTQALNDDNEIPGNNSIIIKHDTTLTYTISNWDNGSENNKFNGQVTGTIEYHKQFSYDGLLPRDIIVWLPPGYNENNNEKYSVLYMHDGQNLFDPKTSFTKVDWQIDEAADSLIRKNEIEPIIIVGISNTAERYAEYTPGDTSQIYKKFVVNKLKPFIDSTYRTLPDRENTYVGGSSSGGTISFMLLWEYSNIFSKAACFSPAFVTKHFNYVEMIENKEVNTKFNLYIDNGGLGIDSLLQPGIDLMINLLKSKGYEDGKDFVFIIDKNAMHNESAWAKRVPKMLKILFAK